MHAFPHRYVVSSTATPQDTIVLASDHLPPLATAAPPEFDGPGGLWSPETLLVASAVDCFVITFRGIARASKLSWVSVSAVCEGTLERPDRVTQFTRFDLRVTVVLPPDASEDLARRVATRAEETCLITRSLKGETHLHITIQQEQLA